MIAFRKLLVIILPLMAWSTNAFGSGGIVVVKIDGAINPAVAEFVTNEIRSANMSLEELIVIQMDTPGGWILPCGKLLKLSKVLKFLWLHLFLQAGHAQHQQGLSLQSRLILLPWNREQISGLLTQST